jgi:hypothetical protein
MKIQTFINIIDNRYRVEIRIYDTTQNENELMEQYGEPLIEVGGNITGSATRAADEVPTDVDFTLSDEQRRLKSDFPLIKYFDLDDDVDSDVKAKVYTDEIVSRITAAKSTLLTNVNDWEGETVTTL